MQTFHKEWVYTNDEIYEMFFAMKGHLQFQNTQQEKLLVV